MLAHEFPSNKLLGPAGHDDDGGGDDGDDDGVSGQGSKSSHCHVGLLLKNPLESMDSQ